MELSEVYELLDSSLADKELAQMPEVIPEMPASEGIRIATALQLLLATPGNTASFIQLPPATLPPMF